MNLCNKVIGFPRQLCLWIILSSVELMLCEVCSNGKTCEYGCCDGSNNTPVCCEQPFWTWGMIVGISVGAIVGIVLLVFCILACIYCKKKPTHSNRLRHTVSMRSNRIRPFPDLPPYEETDSNPYGEPPPKYEDISRDHRGTTRTFPQPRLSSTEPVISQTVTVSPRR